MMGVQDAHSKLFVHVRQPLSLASMQGKRVAIDLASFKLRAFRPDAPSHLRPTEPDKNGYRAALAKLIST